MAENLLRETWANLDSHELRLLLDQRIGGPGQYDGRDANPSKFYLPLARESCRIALTFRDKKIIAVEPGPAIDAAEWQKKDTPDMSTTDRRSITSRQNSQRSTGPKTPEGKAAVRLNAVRFGIFTEVTLIMGESDADLVAFGKRLRADLAPVGELELMLADNIVATAWRLRRLVQIEAAQERAFFRALHEMQRLQAARHGADVAPPQVVDVMVAVPLEALGDDSDTLASFRQNEPKEIKTIKGHARHAEGR